MFIVKQNVKHKEFVDILTIKKGTYILSCDKMDVINFKPNMKFKKIYVKFDKEIMFNCGKAIGSITNTPLFVVSKKYYFK